MRKTLTGEWRFRATDEGEYRQAVVPGCQYLDLMRLGEIPDPYVGANESAVQWIHDKDYIYQYEFEISQEELEADRIDLVCEQLDTICEIAVNGKKIGEGNNCHRAYRFDIQKGLTVGRNSIEIVFRSAKRYVAEMYRKHPCPANPNGQNGIVFIRKPQCHFGWDWGPVLIPAGISGDIYLDIGYGERLGELRIQTRENGKAYEVEVCCGHAEKVVLTSPDGDSQTQEGDHVCFVVHEPRLWWTKELSGEAEQPLYTVCAQKGEGKGAEQVCAKIGLRTIELRRDKDEYGYNFQFVLNGVPLFVKGANYIPPDCFMPRYGKAQRAKLLDAVQYANLNMIRVWGGGYYADDELLAECDRRGILVWQDCAFACQAYPFFDTAFRQNVLDEIEYNVKRMATHASLALWCGNNEIEAMHLGWATMREYVEWTGRFFYEILPCHIAQYDDATPYIAGSPIGSAHNRHVDADWVGDTHLWGVWHGLKPISYFRRRKTRFCSEFGMESLPTMATMRLYARPDEYALDSAVQRAHQKCKGGNDRMLYYMASRFAIGKDIEDMVYASQLVQMECIREATDFWRIHKGQCNGSIYWQLNDCWPTCSWSGYDYGGRYKALTYGAKGCNAPLALAIDADGRCAKIYVLNDLACPKSVVVEYALCKRDSAPVWQKQDVRVEAGQNALIATMAISKESKGCVLAARMWQAGTCIGERTKLFVPEKKLRWPKGKIEVRQEAEEGKRIYYLQSDVYQRCVMLENECDAPFSDNYFDLLPHTTKVVYQEGDGALPLSVKTVADMGKGSKAKTAWAKMRVWLSPANVASALYYSRKPAKRDGQEQGNTEKE